jgi:hypothetical protein
MNVNELHAKLIAIARKNPPLDQVPYAFEKRISHRLAASPRSNFWSIWGRPLWRAAVLCVAITVLCGIWSYASRPGADNSNDLSQSLEAAVFAPVDQQLEEAW